MHPCAVLLLLLSVHGASAAVWQVVHKQTDSAAGTARQPSIRYGHAADRHGNKLIVNLGYYYDRDSTTASWMSDTWEMDMQAPYTWQRLDSGVSQDEAYGAYNSGTIPHSPVGRFGHTSAVHNDTIYVYGGHDGGQSRHGRQNYEPGYDFDELWSFSIPQRKWRLLTSSQVTSSQTKPSGPGKRYLHAAAMVGDVLVLYGGLSSGQGDVWAYDIISGTWEKLADELPMGENAPGRRVGHSLTAVDQPDPSSPSGRVRGVLLFGGRYIDGSAFGLAETVFFFDLNKRAWQPVLPVGTGSTSSPAGRKYHGEASAWVAVSNDGTILPSGGPASSYVHVTAVFGGTLTTPGLTCSPEVWLAALDCGATHAYWQRLPDLHPAVYDVRGAMSASGSVFAYGGHLCSDSKGASPFYYSNSVSKLDLAGVKVPAGACRVPAAQLPLQRGQGESGMGGSEEL